MPNIIEVITNNVSYRVREVEIRGRKVILRKSRVKITNENVGAYTLMELFNNIDIKQYQEDQQIRYSVSKFIREEKITKNDIVTLSNAFPKRTMKNITISGILCEISQN